MIATDAEQVALNAGYKVVQGLTLLAGAMVAISGLSAGAGFFFFFGYLSTIGATWARDMLSLTTLVQYGALHIMVLALLTLVAMLKSPNANLPRVRFTVAAWVILMLSGVVALVYSKWTFVLFAMQVVTGVAAVLILPIVIIRAVRAWQGRTIGVVAILSYVIGFGTALPLAFGISKGLAERAQPQSLSVVVLSDNGDWRLLLALDETFLVTRNVDGVAFREYRLVDTSEIKAIRSSKSGAPWAP
jgi:hypothetical protein